MHVLTAQGLRADESGHAPSAWILLRILNPTLADPTSHSSSVSTHVCKSDGSYTSPASYVWSWGREFQLDVPDGGQSQLQITLWDNAQPSGTSEAFLGEVILNLAKVIPHDGNSHGYRHEMLGTRSKSSDDVPSWIEMALALSGYWLGATFTWLGDRKCGRSSQL